MSNPTKLSFDIGKIFQKDQHQLQASNQNATTIDIGAIGAPKSRRGGYALKVDPTVFDSVVKDHEKTVAEKIAKGELDRHGNPIGTQYWDEDDPTSKKRPRKSIIDPRTGKKPPKYKIAKGFVFGDLEVLQKGKKVKAARANLTERWLCQCNAPGCGKKIIVPRYYLLRPKNPKTHCGCRVATIKSRNPREYRIWMMIHQRLYNPNHVSYEHYKAKGITLEPEWHKDNKDGFEKFFEHVGPSPSQYHSLDRVHNNRGYIKGNLKWSTSSEQRLNQGDRIGGYTLEDITEMGYSEDEFVQMIIDGKVIE